MMEIDNKEAELVGHLLRNKVAEAKRLRMVDSHPDVSAIRALLKRIENPADNRKDPEYALRVEFDGLDEYKKGWNLVEQALGDAGHIGFLTGNQIASELVDENEKPETS